jgi:anti-sigma-K factor RskA
MAHDPDDTRWRKVAPFQRQAGRRRAHNEGFDELLAIWRDMALSLACAVRANGLKLHAHASEIRKAQPGANETAAQTQIAQKCQTDRAIVTVDAHWQR